MTLDRFDALYGQERQLLQEKEEWRLFLIFARAYFDTYRVWRPIVVEIGTGEGAQEAFYDGVLVARHIGIDCVARTAPGIRADIVADSHDPTTVTELMRQLDGDPIDLLFIDGGHDYASVKCDYQLYSPLVRHLVAFHDIFLDRVTEDGAEGTGVGRLWAEVMRDEPEHAYVTFKRRTGTFGPLGEPWEMGIGVIVKKQEGVK